MVDTKRKPSARVLTLSSIARLLILAITMLASHGAAAQTFTLTLQPNTIPAGTQGSSYSQLITAVGGNAPYTFAVTSGTFPPGLNLASNGQISGTPTTPNNYSFTITATDDDGNTGYRPYTFSIGAAGLLTINPASLPNGTQGTGYSQTVTASGGSGGYVYTITSGSLPNGLSLNSGSGTISGTPTAGGSFNFTVRGRDSDGNTGTRAYTIGIGTNSLTLNPSSLPNGQQGVAYSQGVTASGGTGPYTYSISSGSLPAGLGINAGNGTISGTPTGGGPSNFTVRAVDSIGNFGTRAYTITIGTVSLTVNPATLPNGSVGTAYSQAVTAIGGTAPYTFALTAGSLPNGLSLSSGGAVTGTPSAAGTFNFTIGATDPSANTGSRAYSVTISLAPLSLSPSSLPPATQGVAYSQTITASGGTAPYSYAVVAGSLPPGLALGGGSGSVSGTPTTPGSYTFTVQATDAQPNTGTRSYTINVGSNSLTVNPATLPNGTQGLPYSQTVSASGGTGPYTYAATGLPAGLSLNANSGAITGTPTGSGMVTFTIDAADSVGNIGNRVYTINIGTASLTLNPTSLPAGTVSFAYSQTVVASGGTAPYTYALTSGALPTGLSLNGSTGAITGIPSAGGVYNFTVRATDSLSNIGSRAYTVNIGTDSLTVNPSTLPPAQQGRAYSATVTGAGGTAPYTFSLTGGSLPPGITLNATTGLLSGTPTASGSFAFTIQARDINGNIGSRAYTLFPVRPDPAQDPEVQGLLRAQVAATQRLSSAQITNVSRHLDSLHDRFDACSLDFGIAMSQAEQLPPPYMTGPQVGWDAYRHGYVSQPGQGPRPVDECAGRPAWASSVQFWLGGAIEFGSDAVGGVNTGFNTSGLTGGADLRVADGLIVGAAVGYGNDRAEIGSNGTLSRANSTSGIIYASFKPFDQVFIDGMAGYSSFGYDARRFVSVDGSTATGTRAGSGWFASLSASVDFRRGALKVAPFIRADIASTRLAGYSETGTSTALLSFDAMDVTSTSVGVGVRSSYDIAVSWGVISPMVRVEYRQAMDGAVSQSLYYTDLGAGTATTWSQDAASRSQLSGSLGVRAQAGPGLALDLEYGVNGNEQALQSQSVRGAVRFMF